MANREWRPAARRERHGHGQKIAMKLGVDFDNTIVSYDALFARIAREEGLVPAEIPATKSEVRNHLRRIGKEDVWTELQGRVYGARMAEAEAFPGVRAFFRGCRRAGLEVFIISHKTRFPYLGERHDLHAAAVDWLERQGFLDPEGIGLPRERVFFELTKDAKLERIRACGCTHFIDDLPEFLAETGFPGGVERLLLDPNGHYLSEMRFARLTSWPEVARRFGVPGVPELPGPPPHVGGYGTDPNLETAVAALLRGIGLSGRFTAEPIEGGANNRVRRIDADGEAFVLKAYFHDPADARDRFGAERAFYAWAWERGVRRTPEPMAWDPVNRLGLFRFIAGRRPSQADITPGAIDQAAAFVAEVNANRAMARGRGLPIASEACFSVREHVECIDGRVARLRRLDPHSDMDQRACEFVRDELEPAWRTTRSRIEAAVGKADAREALDAAERCVSPSDFGFHNALIGEDGLLRFFDFEYAGWDDPAKLVCDFYCQPRVPVDPESWDGWVEVLDRALGWGGRLGERSRRLLAAYRVKWCCILLNEFVRADRARRAFARGNEEGEERKRLQLDRAKEMLASLSVVAP